MKFQTTKKIFAFIIMMMFFSLTQHAFSQKKSQKTIWACNCLSRDRGCSGLDKKYTKACRSYCIPHDGVKIIDRKNLVNDMAVNDVHHPGSQISFTPIILETDNSSKLFESKKSTLKFPNNSQTQFIQQREWKNTDTININSN
jgi:hypothetical protein